MGHRSTPVVVAPAVPAPRLTGAAGSARGWPRGEVRGGARRRRCPRGHPCPLRSRHLLGSPGRAGDGLCLGCICPSRASRWGCAVPARCLAGWGALGSHGVTGGKPPPAGKNIAPLLEPWGREPLWGGVGLGGHVQDGGAASPHGPRRVGLAGRVAGPGWPGCACVQSCSWGAPPAQSGCLRGGAGRKPLCAP